MGRKEKPRLRQLRFWEWKARHGELLAQEIEARDILEVEEDDFLHRNWRDRFSRERYLIEEYRRRHRERILAMAKQDQANA